MLVWGKKRSDKKRGYVAEFCPFCRDVQRIVVVQERIVPHFYGVGLGSGNTIGFHGTCTICRSEFEIDPNDYSEFAKINAGSIEQLVSLTYPSLYTDLEKRLEVETHLKEGREIDPEIRRALIHEPFNILTPVIEQRFGGSVQMDWKVGISLGLMFILPFFMVMIAAVGGIGDETFEQYILPAVGYIGAAGFILSVYFYFTCNSRYLKAHTYPILANTLKPLNPTLDELETVLFNHKRNGFHIGKRLKAGKIMKHIHESGFQRQMN